MKITIIGHFNTGDLFSEEANNQKEFYYCLDKIFNNAACIYPPDKIIVDRKIPKYIQEWADASEFDILTEIRNSTSQLPATEVAGLLRAGLRLMSAHLC